MRRKCLLCTNNTIYAICFHCIYRKEKSRKGRKAESRPPKRHKHSLAHHAYDGFWDNAVRAYEGD